MRCEITPRLPPGALLLLVGLVPGIADMVTFWSNFWGGWFFFVGTGGPNVSIEREHHMYNSTGTIKQLGFLDHV